MTQLPNLTDCVALARFRARAKRLPNPALFLQQQAVDEIQQRLNEVNRRFIKPAVVTSFPQLWQPVLPEAEFVADADFLDLETEAHDLVIHALSLHWANDPVGQLVQCRRALKPDGLFICATFGGQTLSELRSALAEAETALTGGLSPRVVPMGEIRDLGTLLQRAGFAMPVADVLPQKVSYESLMHLMHDLRAMGETNALSARHKTIPPRDLFTEAACHYFQNYSTSDGRILATFETVYLTGWAPDASQPQPLRPGSAKVRLADALSTEEIPLPDSAPIGRN